MAIISIKDLQGSAFIANLSLAYRIAHYFGKTIEEAFDLSEGEF